MIAETSKGGASGAPSSPRGRRSPALAPAATRALLGLRGIASAVRARRVVRPGHASAAPVRYDSWLQTFWGTELERIDAACTGAGPEALALFRELDADLWALLLTREYDLYSGIKAQLPDVPDAALQETWNGTSGAPLAAQSLAFYEKLRRLYARHSELALERSRVLDFGCGWGRLMRLLARDVAPGALFGCDPTEPILDIARRTRVPGVLARCEFAPRRLPFEQQFELAYAFSVFTHLSERAHRASLQALHAAIVPGGLLVLTIRPPEYLRVCERLAPALESLGPWHDERLDEPLYLFTPHPAQPFGVQAPGHEVTYGETVITPAYIREHWTKRFDLLEFDLLLGDPHQVVVTLRRRGGDPRLD
jgi:SAM-dependent methyltransferase